MEGGQGFRGPMQYHPGLATTSKEEPSQETTMAEDLGLDGADDSLLQGDDDDDDAASVSSGTSQSGMSLHGSSDRILTQELKRHEKTRQQIMQRMKRYESERNTLRQELEKMKQANRTHIKMLKKGHEQVVVDQRKLVQNLEDMISEQDKRSPDDKRGAALSLQRLVEQISSLHKDKTSLIDDNVDLQQKFQESEQDMQQERLHLQGRVDKLKQRLESAQEKSPEVRSTPANLDAGKVKDLQAEVAQLRTALASSQQNKQTIQDPELVKQLKDLQANNQQLQTRLAETEKSHQNKALSAEKSLQGKLDEALSDKGQLHTQLKTARHECDESRKTAGDLQKKVRQLEAVRSELEAQSQQRGKHQGSIEQDLNKTRLDKKLLEEQVSTLQGEFSQLQAVISDLEASERDLQEERRTLHGQLADHATVTLSLSETRGEVTRYEKQVSKLEGEARKQQEEFHRAADIARQDKKQAVSDVERRVRAEMASVQDRMGAMMRIVSAIQRELGEVKAARRNIQKEVSGLQQAVGPGIKTMRKQITSAITEIDTTNKELVRKYKKEMMLRKKYHNEIVELKGNIRVFGRVRPTIKEDGTGVQAEHVVTYDDDDDGLLSVVHRGSTKTFELDKVFQPGSTQEQVFNEVKALLISCVDGFNVCIFAYGQTGSGKTFTMEGYGANPGINPRALQELFTATEERNKDWDYAITVSVMEIYNESIRDLLSDSPKEAKEVKQSRNAADGHYVPGLTWIRVQTVEDVHEVFALGKDNRATAVTDMNEHSSRSHALLCIIVVGTNRTTGIRTVGRLNLVDLAGSERISKSGSEGQRLKEAQNINKSLSSLGDVIHSLKLKSSHIPYRNSKLTYLLQDSLGGDSKTLMMVQVSPVEKNSSETLCSLNFAMRVRSVELGQASRRTETSDSSSARDRMAEHGDGVALSGRGSPAPGKKTGLAAKRR